MMKKQIHSGPGSYVWPHNCKSFPALQEKRYFYANKTSDMPDLQVELKCYAIELKSQTKLKESCKSLMLNNKSYSKNDKQWEEHTRILPTESLSCESFYSCQSSTSIQDIKPKQNSEIKRTGNPVTYSTSSKNDTSSNEELLSQITMMNALFLSKSVKECLKKEQSIETRRETESLSTEVNKNGKVVYNPTVSNRFYSGSFTCQVNKNEAFKYNAEAHNENCTTKLIMKNPNFTLNLLEGESLNLQQPLKDKNNTRKDTTNFEKESANKADYSKNRKLSNTNRKMNEDSIVRNENAVTKSKFVFRKKKGSNLKPYIYNKSDIKVLGQNLEQIPIRNENNITVDTKCYQCKIEQFKQSVNQGYEIIFLPNSYIKSKLVIISPEKLENMTKNKDISYGDGQFINTETIKSLQKVNNLFVENINEPHVNKLINQNLEKLYNESEQVTELYISLSCTRKDLNFMSFSSDLENTLSQKNATTKLMEENYISPNFETDTKFKSDLPILDPLQNNSEILSVKDSTSLITPGSGIDCCNLSYATVTQPDNCIKRKLSERKCSLPVIKEESTESLLQVLSEDRLTDTYCLVDNYGNPLHLFDSQGLPLTDNCGRPLRFADGELLMQCDGNGVPVVDTENYAIYDMFGNNPHEPEFNPAIAPKTTVCNKLSTYDGKPLLLFDVEGRPLTSISGTMLVDSSGRGLVRLSSTATLENTE